MKIITHSGGFHSDELFACATLSVLHNGDIEIVRSRDPEVWATGDYVLDVGGVYDPALMRFDHHQEGGAGARENGIPYSSFGLIWKHYGEKVAGSHYAAQNIDEHLVQPIDAGDNGVETFSVVGPAAPYLLQDVVSSFSPTWNEERTVEDGFFAALEIAKKILDRALVRARSNEEGKRLAEEAYQRAEDKRIIILDGRYPWHEAFSSHTEPLYAITPEREGINWRVEAVRSDPHTFRNRKDLPEMWAGKRGQELADITGVPNAVFCHNKRFIAVAGSQDGAVALAKLAVEA